MFVRPARLFSLLQAALFGVWVDALDANAVTYVPSYLTSVVSKNQSEIYLLRGAGSSSDLSLQSLDLTQSFNTSDIGFETVSSELPFIARQGEPTRTPLPLSHATTSNGTLIVLTGSYHNASAELWAFSRTGTTSTSDHTSWVRVASNSHIVPGLAVHSALIAFAPEETDLLDQELYTYGGMYPQGNADAIYMPIPVYSGNMTSVLISNSSAQHLDLNNMAAAGNRPQAGFSVTPLSPLSSSNGTSHPAYDQTYVLMGGHSANEVGQVYFTNMSKLLLFSLPEETWIPIDVETDTTQLLSKANVGIVEPRSGHSAVLTPDGSKIIVIGGFRVNSTIAAQPQVAVLEVGAGFGGAGAWRWRAPKGPFEGVLDDGSGIFGHGAAVLPGGLILIAGGHHIGSHTMRERTALARRSNITDHALIFDTESESFTATYTAPESATDQPESTESPAAPGHGHGYLSSAGQKAGLAIGLIVAVLLIVATIVWCVRRRQSRRNATNDVDRRLPATEDESSFEAPAVFRNYREQLQDSPATITTGTSGSLWSPADQPQQPPSFSDSDDMSLGFPVAGVPPTDTRVPRGLGLPSSLLLGVAGSEGSSVHSVRAVPQSPTDSVHDSTDDRGECSTVQASQPLLPGSSETEPCSSSRSQRTRGRAASRDRGKYRLVPNANEDGHKPAESHSVSPKHRDVRDNSSAEHSDRTLSSLSALSQLTQSTSHTHPLFPTRIQGLITALHSSSDTSLLRRAVTQSRYEPSRPLTGQQPTGARSLQNLRSDDYAPIALRKTRSPKQVATNDPGSGADGPQEQVRSAGESGFSDYDNLRKISGGYMGTVQQVTGPAVQARYVGEPQSAQAEVASLHGLGSIKSTTSDGSQRRERPVSEPEPRRASPRLDGNGGLACLSDASARLSLALPPTMRSTSGATSDNSFNSTNYPEDGKIELVSHQRIIDPPGRVRLVVSRAGSRRDARSARTSSSHGQSGDDREVQIKRPNSEPLQ